MAKVPNPRKVFNFIVEIDGIDQFEIQEVKLPDQTIDAVQHGDTNYTVKTGGLAHSGNMTFKKLMPVTNSDTWAWTWLSLVQDQYLGGGVLPSAYKRDIVLKEMDTTGLATVNRWQIDGCFPVKVSYNDMNRMASENMMESVELSVDRCRRI
jgi:phage tail-like protein